MKFEYSESNNNIILYDNLVKKINNSYKNINENFKNLPKNNNVKNVKKKKIVI